MTIRLKVPAARLAPAQALVNRHARKAKRLGMPGPALTVVREYQRIWIIQPVTSFNSVRFGDGEIMEDAPTVRFGPYDGLPIPFLPERVEIRALDMVEIEVTGERPVIAGWRFAAVIEATEAGNLLRKHPDHVGDLPVRFRACTSECEHCQTNRRRAETFIVEELHDGVTHKAARYVQVGRSCLGDFTGHADPAVWLACYQWLREIVTFDGWDDGLGGYGMSAPAIGTVSFLLCVATHSRLYGYVSASMARDLDLAATGSEVMRLLTSTQREVMQAARALSEAVTDADRSIVERALAWLASPEAGSSEYIHNLRIHAGCDLVRPRGENMLASLLASYRKYIGETVARPRAQKLNEYLPGLAIKDRVDGLLVTLVREGGYETDYGWTSVYTFEDADGRAVKWRTSLRLEVEIWTRLVLSGSVKALGEYRGRRETELTRCSVEIWAIVDESVEACTAVKPKRRAGSCPAQKVKRGERHWMSDSLLGAFALAPECCDVVGDGCDFARDPFAAFDCAA